MHCNLRPPVLSCNRMSALVVLSGECLRGECLVWLIGAVVCSLAAVASCCFCMAVKAGHRIENTLRHWNHFTLSVFKVFKAYGGGTKSLTMRSAAEAMLILLKLL